MGTDIHAVFQKQVGEDWIDIPCNDWEQQRHYFLFAWLAGVRNGFGFAGVKTGEPILPISPPRGFPDGFETEDSYHKTIPENCDEWNEDEGTIWLGDHSFSWLSGEEILAAKPPMTRHTGVITIDDYNKWDKITRPEAYCGGVSGPDIVVSVPTEIDNSTTHVCVEWCTSGDECKYFIDAVRNLVNEYGNIRMVFGFDS